MADFGKRKSDRVFVLLPDKRVRTFTVYILYKYTRPVELHDQLQRLYEQQTDGVYLALLSKTCIQTPNPHYDSNDQPV